MDWAELLAQLGGGAKQKMSALDQLHAHVQANGVTREQVSGLLDLSVQLLADNNYKVALKLLNCWESIAATDRDVMRPYIKPLLPHVVERLSDNRQEVRQAACNFMLELLQVLRPDAMMQKLGGFWAHKHWKVRHGLLQYVAEAISTIGEAVLVQPRDEGAWVLHRVIMLVSDPESAVRDAAIECLEEVYKVYGGQLVDVLAPHNLRPAHLNAIYARLAQLGADVTPVASESSTASHHARGAGHEHHDTASSCGGARRSAAGVGDHDGSVDADGGVAVEGAKAAKRGGYKDGGGIGTDGSLPEAQPLYVSSERDLVVEMERLTATLSGGAASTDWEKRVGALLRLEGLVKGGAAGSYEETFLELLRSLRDPLLEQLADRRSAVSRQAAHTMIALAASLGQRFEPYAAPFMTALFKMLVITVQVVSEAADAAARGILHHCHALKLVTTVCDALAKDRNGKLRQFCSLYLLQILEEWHLDEYSRALDSLEPALTAAVQDAVPQARAAGRESYAAYAAVLPDRAAALLQRLNFGLQSKLNDALTQYQRGAHLASATTRGGPGAVLGGRPSTAGQRVRSAGLARAAAAAGGEGMGPPPAKPRTAGGAGRFSSSSACQRSALPTASATAVPCSATVVPVGTPAAAVAASSRPPRKSIAGMPMRVPGGAMALGSAPQGMMHGMDCSSAGPVAAGTGAGAAAATAGRRRASVLPQRVPAYHPGSPPRATPGAAGRLASVPGSPDSAAPSESSTAHSVGGGAARLQQYGKQPQHGSLSRTASASDDLQLQSSLRDQLAWQNSHHHHHQQQTVQVHHVMHQHAPAAHHSGVLGVAAAIAAAGAGLAAAGGGGAAAHMRPTTLARAVAAINSGKDWKERADAMDALAALLAKQAEACAPPEAYAELERAAPRLLAAADDAHFKVALSALAALQACVAAAPHMMEPGLDKLMPLLFLKLCAAKQAVRSAAEAALQACALHLPADSLLPALTRSLEAMKQPAARVSVMEFAVLFLGDGKVAGAPSAPGAIRQWLGRNIPLLLDKNLNVRHMAARALGTMYTIDPQSVAACLQHATPVEVAAVQRSLTLAEAHAVAEEQEEAAAAAAAAARGARAEHVAAWAHVGHWGTGAGTLSTASSVELPSSAAAAASADATAAAGYAPDAGAAVVDVLTGVVAGLGLNGGGHTDYVQHVRGVQPPSQDAPWELGGSTAATAAAAQPDFFDHQHQQQQQLLQVQSRQQQDFTPHHHYQQQYPPSAHVGTAGSPSLNNTPAAGAARDVLGRIVPAAASPATAALAASPAERACAAAGAPANAAPVAGAATPPSPLALGSAAAAAAAAAAQGDAAAQARHLTLLVHRLQSRAAEEPLAELAACAGTLCSTAWAGNFSKVLLAALGCAGHAAETVRELAFLLVLALARHHGALFEPVLDVVLQPLLQGCADDSREVLMAAQSALDVLMTCTSPLRSVEILAHKLPSDTALASGTAVDGEVLRAAIRCLQAACVRMPAAELLAVAPSALLPGLFAAYQHARPDVRKAAVYCLVHVWHTAGEGLTPHLASLSTWQLKLLTNYYNRVAEGQAAML